MAEYTAYFDDSGHPEDQDFLLVGGFVSTEEQWFLFGREWRGVLDRYGIAAFHMTDFERSKKWTRCEKDTILLQLTSLIRARVQYCVVHGMSMNDYREVNNVHALEQFVGKPFALVARSVMAGINKWKRAGLNRDNVLTILEDGTLHRGDFMDAMARDGLPCPTFAKKAEGLVPLQAADWLAWEAFQAMKTNIVRSSLARVLDAIPHDEGVYEKDNLLEMCELIPVPKYEDLPPNAKVSYMPVPHRVRKRSIYPRISEKVPAFRRHES
jgi:hypothetical protein